MSKYILYEEDGCNCKNSDFNKLKHFMHQNICSGKGEYSTQISLSIETINYIEDGCIYFNKLRTLILNCILKCCKLN